MNIKSVDIAHIKTNPNNPRIIKDDKYRKLVESIRTFPKMLEIRPIVVNADMIVLGGNMRLRACKEAGLNKIPVIMADDLTPEQQREFIIKDNVGFGEWDWEMLANEWEAEELDAWGLNVPNWSLGVEENEMSENELNLNEEFDPIGVSSGLLRVVFIFYGTEEAESYLNSKGLKYSKKGEAWQVNLSTQSI
jgi:hypothetical protein